MWSTSDSVIRNVKNHACNIVNILRITLFWLAKTVTITLGWCTGVATRKTILT